MVPLFIDECFANIRGPGEAIGLHSGGHEGTKRTQFRFYNGQFHCGQINILMALTDIGPGDGGTMVVPASHKAHFPHPDSEKHRMRGEAPSVDGVEGAIRIDMDAGDVLLFVDAICHGSAERVNAGERRIIVFRYGPSWGNFRHGYRVSNELVARPNAGALANRASPDATGAQLESGDHDCSWLRRSSSSATPRPGPLGIS